MCEKFLYSSLNLFSTLGLVHDIVQHLHTHVDHSAIATRHTTAHTTLIGRTQQTSHKVQDIYSGASLKGHPQEWYVI